MGSLLLEMSLTLDVALTLHRKGYSCLYKGDCIWPIFMAKVGQEDSLDGFCGGHTLFLDAILASAWDK